MAKRGRKPAYETIIKPQIDDIAEAIRNGRQIKDICNDIGISVATWCRIAAENQEFSEIIKKSRGGLVSKLYSAMVKRAVGFQYTETKKVTERDPDTGKMILKRIEETVKTCPGDVGALHLLLKNLDKENWSNDPRADDLKREELEFKKAKADSEDW